MIDDDDVGEASGDTELSRQVRILLFVCDFRMDCRLLLVHLEYILPVVVE